MWKPPKNPIIEELTKSYRERIFNIGDIEQVKLDGVNRNCVWCLDPLTGKKIKWCGKQECIDSALAWGNPQKEWGAGFLLMRQDWKCAGCAYDWKPLADNLNGRFFTKKVDVLTELSPRLVKLVKNRCPKDRRIEIDHVVAISLGGTPIGLENVRALCNTCHKEKTKADAKERANKKKA